MVEGAEGLEVRRGMVGAGRRLVSFQFPFSSFRLKAGQGMARPLRQVFPLAFAALLGILARPCALKATDLEPRTLEAFERYVHAVDARAARQQDDPGHFLYINTLPESERRLAWATIERGEVWVDSPNTRNAAGRSLSAPGGLINHWVGAAFIPGVSLAQVVAVLEDYDHYQDIYKPQFVRSRLVSREGNDFKIFLRLRKKTPWVAVTLNIDSETWCTPLDGGRASLRSHSTRIAQVEAVDTPHEHEFAPGHDSGYLWRFETYWRLEARQGGVAAEWEAIMLSRDIPRLVRWIVKPFVERLARSTVQDMLVATRKAARNQKPAAQTAPPEAARNQEPAAQTVPLRLRNETPAHGLEKGFPKPSWAKEASGEHLPALQGGHGRPDVTVNIITIGYYMP